jgi:hypothetical protein
MGCCLPFLMWVRFTFPKLARDGQQARGKLS